MALISLTIKLKYKSKKEIRLNQEKELEKNKKEVSTQHGIYLNQKRMN